jgi:DNA polymerase
MSDTYFLDFETHSEADLKKVGAYRYASDPSTEILVMAIARNDGPVQVWDCAHGGAEAIFTLHQAVESGALIYAHNAQFEHAVCRYLLKKTFNIEPPTFNQWRCTAAMCRLAAIPSSLKKAGDFLDIDMPKDKEGGRLIKKFSVPRKATKNDPRTRIMPEDDPEDFAKFVEYCRRDVPAAREIHGKLETDFPLDEWALDSFQADMEMNDRGIPVNINALVYADSLMEEYIAKMVPKFREQVATTGKIITLPVTTTRKAPKDVDISEGFNPSQRELFNGWLADEGFTGTDLTTDTVADWLRNGWLRGFTKRGQAALHTYSLISSAAVKKIPAMLAMACDDGYVRGALLVFGAERTHRWTGRGMQPQNFARPRIRFTELAYDMLCQRCSLEEIESVCGDFFDVLVSVIRHFIQPHDGVCLQADYSSIEARVAPWLVGEQKKLDLFAKGEPIYEIMAQRIFGGKVEDITTDQRFIGKQAELGCTYNMGAPKFRGTCEGYGFEPSGAMLDGFANVDAAYDDLAERAVAAWRKANPTIVQSWTLLDKAAKWCIQHPKKVKTVGLMKLTFRKVGGFDALLIKLPSGHRLVYPKARLATRKGWGDEIQFYGVIPNSGGQWGWCSTYGGKILENCTQAAAGDVMRHGMQNAARAGYHAFMLVHDEILTLKTADDQTHGELCDLLCDPAPWMDGLPLAAEGGTLPFYKK